MYNDILYTVNKKYLPIFLASMDSLLKNSGLEDVRIHLVTEGFSTSDFELVSKIIDRYPGTKINTYTIDWFDISRFNLPEWRGTQIANARLFLESVIDLHDVHHLLYLDADTIVVGPLTDLKEKYGNSVIAAAYDGCLRSYGNSLGLDKYYNSGVLYINIEKWFDIEAEERIKDFIRHCDIELSYPDQDVLNIALKDYYETLSLNYNLAPYIYALNEKSAKRYFNKDKKYIDYESAFEASKDPRILHTIGLFGVKPWMVNDVNPYNDIFMEYLLSVDPTFTREEMPLLKRLFTYNKDIFYMLLTARTYFPDKVEGVARNLSLNLQHAKKRNKK